MHLSYLLVLDQMLTVEEMFKVCIDSRQQGRTVGDLCELVSNDKMSMLLFVC